MMAGRAPGRKRIARFAAAVRAIEAAASA